MVALTAVFSPQGAVRPPTVLPRRPRGPRPHYSSTLVEHGDDPERASGDDEYPAAPLPPHERVWRHPSELGGGTLPHELIEPQPSVSRGLAAGAAVVGVLMVVALTRLMVPGDVDSDLAVSVTTARQFSTSPLASSLSSTTTTLLEMVTSTLPATTLVGQGPVATDPPSTPPAPPTTEPLSVESSVPVTEPVTTTPSTPSTVAPPQTALLSDTATESASVAVEVQRGTLYVTTSAAIGSAHSTPVMLSTGEVLQADVVMVDEDAGIAVLLVATVDDTEVTDPSMPASQDPAPGDEVTMLSGSGSGERAVGVIGEDTAANGGHELLADSGAAISPGEGAPILDAEGNLVGLCTSSGERLWVVPAAALNDAIEASVDMSRSSAWLGITGTRGPDGGIEVLGVDASSPAEAAGILVGDVIREFAGRPVMSLPELAFDMADHTPGDDVTIVVERDGESVVLGAVLGERPSGA